MEDQNGPNLNSLRRLKGMLPSFIRGMREKNVTGKGKSAISSKPRQVCRACTHLFDYIATKEEIMLKPGVCPDCQKKLDDGMICLVSDQRVAWLTNSKRLADMGGKITRVSPFVMDKLVKEYDAQNRSKDIS